MFSFIVLTMILLEVSFFLCSLASTDTFMSHVSLWFYATLFVMILVICLTNKNTIIIMIYRFNYEMPTFQWDNFHHMLDYWETILHWEFKVLTIDCISTQTATASTIEKCSSIYNKTIKSTTIKTAKISFNTTVLTWISKIQTSPQNNNNNNNYT